MLFISFPSIGFRASLFACFIGVSIYCKRASSLNRETTFNSTSFIFLTKGSFEKYPSTTIVYNKIERSIVITTKSNFINHQTAILLFSVNFFVMFVHICLFYETNIYLTNIQNNFIIQNKLQKYL